MKIKPFLNQLITEVAKSHAYRNCLTFAKVPALPGTIVKVCSLHLVLHLEYMIRKVPALPGVVVLNCLRLKGPTVHQS